MSKNKKIFLGVLTFLPIIAVIAYLWIYSGIIIMMKNAGAPDAVALSGNIKILLFMNLIIIPFILGLLIFYIIHAANNKKLTDMERVMWIVSFLLLSIITFIIYWILKIWKDDDDAPMLSNTGTLDDDLV